MRAKPESLQGDRQVTINSLFGRGKRKKYITQKFI